MRNLWQDLETLESDINNPIELVETQSEYLQDGTKGLFYIEIDEVHKISSIARNIIADVGIKSDFTYKMSLRSAYLPDYAFDIFRIFYGITFYPLLISIPNEIGEKIGEIGSTEELSSTSKSRMYFLVKTEDEYEQLLEAIFNCEKVRTVLKNMKAIIGDESQDE